ncbi:MAG: methyltransferase domain-containing protein [Thermoplasmata archaeon]|nr:methyltransferase domain-containing protein [Thermoplasmata archaeon]
MRLLLELSNESDPLSKSEAVGAIAALGGRPRRVDEDPGVLIVDTPADPVLLGRRLGLCHRVCEWLGTCGVDEVEATSEGLDVPGPVRVRSTKVGLPVKGVDLETVSRRVGGILGRKAGVDLHSPASDVRVIFSKRAHIGRTLWTVDRPSFEKRKNRYLPFHYPASLHPKYARAMVNLTRVGDGGRLLDPFCGTGAILAEAHLAGTRAIGSDISERMIEGAGRNLRFVGAEAELHLCDVGAVPESVGHVDGIATDPPYGRSTSTNGEGIEELYGRALGVFSSVLDKRGRLAIVVPDLGMLADVPGFRLLESHPLWVHRSLTRNFCVLERV